MNKFILEDGRKIRYHYSHLKDLLLNSKGTVRISSAYVTDRALLSFVKNQDIRLLTSLSTMDIVSGATSLETLRWMLEFGINIRRLHNKSPKLHAKTYIFGTSAAVITSANLTQKAFNSNFEVGVELKGKDLSELIVWYDKLWHNASPLTMNDLSELQLKAKNFREMYAKLKRQCQSEILTPTKQITNGKFTDSLQNLFETAPRFFVCNTNRRDGSQTRTGGYELEQEMYSHKLAVAWTSFKFPDHMKLVQPGDGIFMFAKKVGIIGIGVATTKCEVLSSTDTNRISISKNRDVEEWRVHTNWLDWKDDADAYLYPDAPNFTFWNITDKQYDSFRDSIKLHFINN